MLGLQREHLHVERLDPPGVTALLPEDYILGANPDGRPWIEHANATTVHRAQGQTVDHAVAVTAAGANRSQLYVQATRGRLANHVVVDGAGDRNQALAVLRTTLDQLPDDVTGIEHSETPPVAAPAQAQEEPQPQSPPQRRQRRDSTFDDVLARAKSQFEHITFDEMEDALEAVTVDGKFSIEVFWRELARRNELLQQPEPPPLEPLDPQSGFDLDL